MKLFGFILIIGLSRPVFAYPSSYEAIRAHQSSLGYTDSQLLKWSKSENPKAIFLVVHGLNNPPSIMDSLSQLLIENNYNVLRVTLRGHGGDGRELKNIQGKDWVKDIELAYRIAKAEYPQLDINFLGYSTGALAGEVFLAENQDVGFKKTALLAPALRTKFYTHFVKALFWVPQLQLFSKNFQKYRAHKSIPVQAYRALFDLIKKASQWTDTEAKRIDLPTLVIMNPNDELISIDGIKKMQLELGMQSWKFIEVDNEGARGPGVRPHLLLNEDLLPPSEWKKMTEEIINFF